MEGNESSFLLFFVTTKYCCYYLLLLSKSVIEQVDLKREAVLLHVFVEVGEVFVVDDFFVIDGKLCEKETVRKGKRK